jgi:hypothetical protein
LAEAERLRQSLLADAGRGDLLKTIIDRVELRPNGLRMILSLVPLTPAAAPPNRLQGCVFTREFPLRIKRRGVEARVLETSQSCQSLRHTLEVVLFSRELATHPHLAG